MNGYRGQIKRAKMKQVEISSFFIQKSRLKLNVIISFASYFLLRSSYHLTLYFISHTHKASAHVKVEKPEITTCTNLREKQPKSRTVKVPKKPKWISSTLNYVYCWGVSKNQLGLSTSDCIHNSKSRWKKKRNWKVMLRCLLFSPIARSRVVSRMSEKTVRMCFLSAYSRMFLKLLLLIAV